jgi:predicted dehydrogenase/threonine dehydrogenase-like Zn-dependent dehydrogenase
MKQVVRRAIDRRGRVVVLDLPSPQVGPEQVLVHNRYSLISSGTELSTLSKTPLELARQTISDPWMRHVVKQTVFATGVGQTARRVWYEMLAPREIGYSGAGTVLAVGEAVDSIKVGDTVAYAATGHAELVAPTINHIAAVPAGVDLRHAAFVTVGGIAIHALRRADLQFGEVVAVYGLGLVGQLCARVAKAAGCVVVGIDIDPRANELAAGAGVDLVVNPADPEWKRRVLDFTDKHGVDATVICASSDSPDIVNSAMEITRRQGRVVIVGYVRLDIHPKNFLFREIDLRYSRAYGPGSYHAGYEKGRIDYPYGYVRWTEKRNLDEFVRLVATGAIQLESLIGGVFDIDDAQRAFDAIRSRELPGIAALIRYSTEVDTARTLDVMPRRQVSGDVGIALIGCGNHVLGKHLPNLQAMPGVTIRGIASATGKNATMVAARVGATAVTTDIDELVADPGADAVMICSAQPEHFGHIMKAIDGGKAVFVEKPMVTRLDDFARVLRRMEDRPVLLTLGLNRRYSPIVGRLRDAIDGPIDSVEYTITQPYLPPDHWTIDPVDGGGRLITEGEHFVDLCHLLVNRPPISVYARALGREPDDLRTLTNFAITIHYDGAVANIVFSESGSARYPRERLTVLARGQVAILDDFAKLTVHGREARTIGTGLKKSMGHAEELQQFVAALRGEPNRLLSWDDASLATLSMFAAEESIRTGEAVNLADFRRRLLAEPTGEDDGASPPPGSSPTD